jgi:DNA recombination protein RmuC
MEMFAVIVPLLIGLAVGGGAAWYFLGRGLTRSLQEERLRSAESDRSLAEALARAEKLSADLTQERIDHAAAKAIAERVPDLEGKLAQLTASTTKLAGEKAASDTAAARVPQLEAELATEKKRAEGLVSANSGLSKEIEAAKASFEEKVAALTALRGEIEKEIKNLASEALKGNQTSFLNLANQVFEKHRETAAGDLEQRKKAIEALLTPMATTLEEYRKGLTELEKGRVEAYAGLTNELKNVAQAQADVRSETSKLVNALKAAPKTRGRWGEEQLKNVMELSGMTPYVDFDSEVTVQGDDGRLRPDAIIKMPGHRHLVVDAKTSLAGYLEALEHVDDDGREACLKRHAQQVRTHMKQLSQKAYWDGLGSIGITPDFVVMFIPGENFFAAAIERDPELFEDGIKFRVLIATPTTLVALAKAIAFGWRQEKVAENAQRIQELARDLYKRLAAMGGHVAKLGDSLEHSVKHYNKFVGSIEGMVMPQARKFTELEVEGAQEVLEDLTPIETDVRQARRDRDLTFEDTPLIEAQPREE